MKVLLTASPRFDFQMESYKTDIDFYKINLRPSLALYQLASVLQPNHQVEILDPALSDFSLPGGGHLHMLEGEMLKELRFANLEKRIAGMDAICISTTSFDWFLAKSMIGRIKEQDNDLPIIVGGIHSTIADRYLLESSDVDFAARGEGEKTLPELLASIEDGGDLREIDGLSYKIDGAVRRNRDRLLLTAEELEKMPFPALELMPSGVYGKLTAETARGCHYKCAFCSISFSRSWRGISPERAIKRIEHAASFSGKLYGQEKSITLVDDNFTADPKRSEKILKGLREVDLGEMSLAFEGRANEILGSNILPLCKDLPLDYLFFGVECGYERGLKMIQKGIHVDTIIKCAEQAKGSGLLLHYGFIAGLPWETKEDCLKTVAFANRLVSEYDGFAFISWFHMFPGSRLWDERKMFGIDDGLELFDGISHRTKEYRPKISPNLSGDDLREIEHEIDKCNLMRVLSHNDSESCADEIAHSAYTKEGGYCLSRTKGYLQRFELPDKETSLIYIDPT
ncbi:MAG: B12 binding domain protein [Methanosaeta sp. PtaU1.Bin112]|nr:MAG: B12 binding domain protein [Methanosaeta sp. PtaU1.Bin112]